MNDRKGIKEIRIELNDIRIVLNNKYNEGMFSSIKAGVEVLSKNTDAFFILPVDIPSVKDNN